MSVKHQRKEDRAAEEAKPDPRMTEYELWPIVVESGIMNTPDDRNAHLRLMQYAGGWCSPATSAFVFKIRARLPALIDHIWRWGSIDSAVDVFWAPTHPNFPLHGLEGAKIASLDEFRYLTSVVPLASQFLWLDGSAVPIPATSCTKVARRCSSPRAVTRSRP